MGKSLPRWKARSAALFNELGGAMKSKNANALELRHPFFLPLWRRAVVVLLLAIWTVIELSQGNPYWALLTGGIGVYAIYVFFFDFKLPEEDTPDKK